MIVPLFGYIILFFLGICLGSYLNSWMWREHEGVSLRGRSKCVHCKRNLGWFENIPLVSFLALRGKCKTCHKLIPVDYFLVELAMGLGFLLLGWHHFNYGQIIPALLFRDFFFFSLLAVIFVYDLKYYLIISNLVWSGVAIALIINLGFLHVSLFDCSIAIVIGAGFFLLQYLVSKGRWIGGGDVRLGVMMGALLGFPNILVALFIAYVGGGLVSLPLLIFKKKGMQSQIPFGTFLSVATLVTMLWGSQIASWYLGLVGW
jgi:prepilin signal peptidase PulO-like enzyme (type II secretory pathway)